DGCGQNVRGRRQVGDGTRGWHEVVALRMGVGAGGVEGVVAVQGGDAVSRRHGGLEGPDARVGGGGHGYVLNREVRKRDSHVWRVCLVVAEGRGDVQWAEADDGWSAAVEGDGNGGWEGVGSCAAEDDRRVGGVRVAGRVG